MTSSREMIIVGGVVDSLRKHGSWTSETHVQKTAYIAKYVKSVPIEAEFVLYKHGPYSFDLNKSIGHMITRNVLILTPQTGYGPSLSLNTAMWKALDKAVGGFFAPISERIDFVCKHLARKNVSDLERISTAVYVEKNFPNLSLRKKIAKLSELKPHIDDEAATLAFEEAKQFF